MKKKLALLLAIVMVVSFMLVGCGGSIKGTWTATIDLSDALNEYLSEDGSNEMAQYFNFSGLELELVLEIEDDENYTFGADEDSLDEFVDELVEQGLEGLENYARAMGVALGSSDKAQFEQQLRNEFSGSLKAASGTYTFEDDELIIESENGNTKTFEYSGGELKYVESNESGYALEEALRKATFTKK